jgi:hypothetical protein
MPVDQQLYAELKGDLATVSGPLFDLAEQLVRKQGAFLPFGAVLSSTGEVSLQAAASEQDVATSEDVLPILIEGLQQAARPDASAAAVAEWVKIGMEGGAMVDAMKVQVHHRRGLCVSFYVLATKRFLKGWQFGDTIVQPAEPIVIEWAQTAA